jgi:hypothetical protein
MALDIDMMHLNDITDKQFSLNHYIEFKKYQTPREIRQLKTLTKRLAISKIKVDRGYKPVKIHNVVWQIKFIQL